MKGLLRSKLVLSLAALIMIVAAVIVPLSSTITRSHAAAASSPASPGALWVTGHDVDYHCSNSNPTTGAGCHYLQVAVNFVVNFVRKNITLPILALDHGTEVATAISNAFGSNAPSVTTVDPRTGFASLPLVSSSGVPLYSAIIVASDITCNGCDNNDAVGVTPDSDAINARAADIKAFFNAGGGILALAGADNMSIFYNFLPIAVTGIPVSPPGGNPGGFTLTALGQSLGLTASDINCCITHNSFQLPASGSHLLVVEKDSAGNAETLIAPLWGVDSADSLTKWYTQVTKQFGTPDFFGRYIGDHKTTSFVRNTKTGNPCVPQAYPYNKTPVSPPEMSTAHSLGLSILPIYFDYGVLSVYDDVNGIETWNCGELYATKAIAFAQNFAISQGTAIFVDIENACDPPTCKKHTPVVTDADFIRGWFDTFNSTFRYVYNGVLRQYNAGTYKAGYYANTNPMANFDGPFCTAVRREAAIGTNSLIWTTQPNKAILSSSGNLPIITQKANAPSYSQRTVSCPPLAVQIPTPAAWQYAINSSAHPYKINVDIDEALGLPLWKP
jgi:hypothetical protein